MHIGANISKGRIRVRMWNVFARKYWDVSICSVHIFLYTSDPIEWG